MATPFIALLAFFIVSISLLPSSATSYSSDVHQSKISSALFIFGDSSVDVGNNNYINTLPGNQANYLPYGNNGFFQGPTGRFSNGRVIVDFIAEYANLPMIPAFSEPAIDYSDGVNFASGGAGVLISHTNQDLAIDLPTQIANFGEVHETLIEELGDRQAQEIISNAVYFFSIGANDYISGYLGNPHMQELHKPYDYVQLVIGNLTDAIQILYDRGARKFGFLGLGPLGCMPALRAFNDRAQRPPGDGCFAPASALGYAHDSYLDGVLKIHEQFIQGFIYSYSKFHNWFQDRANSPSLHGFQDGVNACCGTGPYRGSYTCGGHGKVSDYELCENGDEHVWWDAFHVTEKIHMQLAEALWNGHSESTGPYTLKDLFFSEKESTDYNNHRDDDDDDSEDRHIEYEDDDDDEL